MKLRKNSRNTDLILLLGLCFILIGFVIFSNSTHIVKTDTATSPVPTETKETSYAKAVKVIDGDTIEIESGDKVRYIGIDTTELYPKVECYARESKAENEKLVLGKTVRLEKDVSETDKYGRLLRYVYVDSGPSTSSGQTPLSVNDYLVKFGFAKTQAVPPDVKYKSQFEGSQVLAKQSRLGIWSACKAI